MKRHPGSENTDIGGMSQPVVDLRSTTGYMMDNFRRAVQWSCVALCVVLVSCASALADPSDPAASRAARLTNVQGSVQLLRGTSTEFQQALSNMPLMEGSRLVTSNDGRAEVQLEDGSIARITPNSSLSLNVLRRNSDGSMVTEVELLSGLGYFELKAAAGQQLDAVRFGTNLLTANTSAVLRVNRDADPAEVAVLAGELHVAGGTQFNVDVHTNETIRFDGADPSRYYLGEGTGSDSWDQWNSDRDQALAQSASQESVVAAEQGGTDNPAWSDLNDSGSWYSLPGYGNVWTPTGVGPGWDPYGYGHWVYYAGYGYVWVSGYPWGWLPYRCGGWNYFDSFGWGWLPGGGCGYGYGFGGGLGSGVVVYSSPGGYTPPARPILKGPVPRLAGNQKVIPVDRGVHARSISPVTITGSNAPPRPIVYAGQRIEPISAKSNPGRGTMWGTPLRESGTGDGSPRTAPWFVQTPGGGAARSGAHTVQQSPTIPGNTAPVSRPATETYQPPPWAAPERSLPPSRPAGIEMRQQAPPVRSAPPPAQHYSAPSAPPMSSAPVTHSSPAPSSSPAGSTKK